jgi:ADP-ribose pyrophosphatase YjhB (NUDIX family)
MDDHQKPFVTVDIVPLTIHEDRLKVLLADRDRQPHPGRAALLGGFIHVPVGMTPGDASAGDAARRVLREKAGITQLYVEQLSTFSGPDRDPRGWSLSVAYFSLSPFERIEPALAQPHLHLVEVEKAVGLPFDHDLMVRAAVSRLRGKGPYSDLSARLLPPEFPLSDLREAYRIATGDDVDASTFRTKTMERGFLERAGDPRRVPGIARPVQFYRLKPGTAVFDRRI